MSASTPGSPTAAAAAELPRSHQILSAMNIAVPQIEPPAGYAWIMSAVAAFLVLIPLAYLALLLFLVWLLFWHVCQTFSTLSDGPYFLFHAPMAFLAGLLLIFLIKPVFFRSREDSEQVITLDPAKEPLLFAFVRRLCAATRSLTPARIEVDCEPNAHARLHRGLLSIFSGGDLVLRIGLPLAAGLPIRQFAGILAHEFGHFNQRSGMSGSYLIRRLSDFFAKIVFQRDRLDAALERLRHAPGAFRQLFYWVSMPFIESARGVLWLMLMLGELTACGVLRRMEYDADQFEAHVSGTREFIRTNRLMIFLFLASRRARDELAGTWRNYRLADNLPRLIVANARQLAEHRADIFNILETQTTQWFDTHPSHNDRVKNVQRLGAPGLLQLDLPSKYLFSDFDAICRQSTEAFYRWALGEEFSVAKLVPTSELIEQGAEQRQAAKALRRFFRDQVVGLRPVLPESAAEMAPDDPRQTARELAGVRESMLRVAESVDADEYQRACAEVFVAQSEISLCDTFPLSNQTHAIRNRAQRRLREQMGIRDRAMCALQSFEQLARQRLTGAFQLLFSPALRSIPAEELAALRDSASSMLGICNALQPYVDRIAKLPEMAIRVRVLCSAYDDKNPFPPLVDRVLTTTSEILKVLRSIESELSEMPYPYEHARQGASIGAALVPKQPDHRDPIETHGTALSAVDRFCELIFRTLGRLSEIAEKVETAIGLAPLPEPEDREDRTARIKEAQARRDVRKYWLSYGGRAAAGIVLVLGLVWLSISPPTLPSMAWGSAQSSPYRPAGFRTSVRSYTAPPPSISNYPRFNPNYSPRRDPDYPQPYRRTNPNNPNYPPGYDPQRNPPYTPPPRNTPPPRYTPPQQPPRYNPGPSSPPPSPGRR